MKQFKKIMASFLILCLVIGMIPASAITAFAAEEESLLAAELAEAKAFTDALTINNNLNDPAKVVQNFKTHFTWDNEKREGEKSYLFDWSYYNGVVFEGIEYLYEVTGENIYKEYVEEYMSSLIASNGTWAKCSNDSSKTCAGYNSTHGADCYKTASLLLDAYEMTNDSRYLTMAKTLYADLDTAANTYYLKNAGNNYRHTWASDSTPDLWLDGLYMILPFRAEYAKYANDTEELDLIVDRMQWVSDNMYNKDRGLFYHAADSATSNSGTHWLRAIGWYAAAIVDIMDSMEGENLEAMKKQLVKLVDGMKACQNTSNGMWLNNMAANQSSTNPYETSGTALTCYAVMKAVNEGWLDESYADMAILAFKGICSEKLNGNTLTDICFKGAPGSGNSTFYDNEGKGVGPFIMFYAEMLEYVNNLKVEEPETPVVPEEPETDNTVTVGGNKITVEGVTGLTGGEVNFADKALIALNNYNAFVAYDINATLTGDKATVSVPVPAEWNAMEDELVGISVENAVVKEIKGTLSADGIYTFEVDHFSAKGVALTAERKSTGYAVEIGATGTQVTTVNSGNFYLLQNTSHRGYLTNTIGDNNKLQMSGNSPTVSSNNLWYITSAGNNSFTVQHGGENGNYLTIGNGTAGTTNGETTINISYVGNTSRWQLGLNGQYLNRYNANTNLAAGWRVGASDDAGSRWNLYEVSKLPVNLIVDPGTFELKPGQEVNLDATVTVGNEKVSLSDCTITWYSNDSTVASVNNGRVTANTDGYTSLVGTLTGIDGYVLENNIRLTVPVTVQSKVIKSVVLNGNAPMTTPQNVEPNFDNLKLIVTYDDNTNAEFTVENGLSITDYDVSKIGSCYALINYQGKTYGTIRIDVTGTNANGTAKTPYDGLETTTDYPEYPNQGAVRIDKKATSEVGEFERTGVTHVELDVAGISAQKAVDVVLVVDVSNSMAWSVENSGNSSDADRVPSVGQTSKIRQTMESCKAFAKILMEPNKDGTTNDNTITFVTFGGFDDKHEATNTEYFDSTNTWMLGEKNLDTINAMFDSVSIERNEDYNGDYRISINGVTGGNFGNTVYDYGFAETMDAINRLQGNSYDTNKRETYVVFMTDGAPSNYNGGYYKGGRSENLKVESNEQFENKGSDNQNTWFNYINSAEHKYARQVYDKVNGKFSTVGFDLAHGGFNKWQWSEANLTSFLEKIVRDNRGNGLNPVVAATDEAELAQFYKEAAEAIKAAGSQGRVTDIIGEKFTLQLASATGLTTSEPQTLKTPPKITVTKYDLWTAKDTDDLSLIGKRKIDENGNPIKEVLETVTFNAAGTEAYSNRVEHGNKNILNTTNDTVTINAQTFTYTKTPDGVETFYWFIETISKTEVVLEFDAYLKGSMEGQAPKGTYYTNEEATLEYIDINGKYVNRLFPVPVVNWGGATTTVRYYLVNENGQPVNRAGQVVPDTARIYVGDPVTVPLNLNADLTISSDQIKAIANVPDGYFLYDNQAHYSIQTTSSVDGIDGDIVKSEPSPDAFKTTGTGSNAKKQTGAQTTVVIDYEPGYYTYSTVGFGVRWDLTQEKVSPLENDKIVIDYGKTIQTDVLANDVEEIAVIGTNKGATYTAQLVGFAQYKENADLSVIQVSEGLPTITGKSGTFSINNGKVEYQPNAMISEVEKVFCVVKLTNDTNDTDFFYMHEQLDVIPATIMYYETDFADGVFTNVTTGEAWDTKNEGPAADGPQDDGTIGVNQTYGYDSTYNNDSKLSNGSSLFVEGQGIKLNAASQNYTYSQFEFTGTGFDLISRTGAEQGAIRVDIYSDKDRTNEVKSVTVLNKSESALELYQIPVVSVNDLPYDTYYVNVGVNAAYENEKYPQLNRGGEFYFDAIRIFNPAKGNAEAEAAYKADNEFNMSLIEVREKLLESSNYNGHNLEVEVPGFTFVDSTYTDGNPDGVVGNVVVGEYAGIGPNNEVYLAKGQGISFKVALSDVPRSIDIGAKSIKGEKAAHIQAFVSGDGNAPALPIVDEDIASSTVQFYELVNKDNVADFSTAKEAYVFITNTGDDVLSITDLKVAYADEVSAANEIAVFSNARTLMFARACMAQPVEVIESAEITSVKTDKSSYTVGDTVKTTVTTNAATSYVTVNGKKVTEFTENGDERVWTLSTKTSKVTTLKFNVVAYNELDEASEEVTKTVTVKQFAPKKFKIALSKKTVVVGDKVKVTVTTSTDVKYVKINGKKVTKYANSTSSSKTWTLEVKTTEVGNTTIKAVAYNKNDSASKTITATATVKKFAPKTFNTTLSKSTVKVGEKYTVSVKTSADVKYVKVNGKKITEYTTNKDKTVKTFKVTYKEKAAGKKSIKVIAYNKNNFASNAKTKTLKVKKK